MNISNKKRFYFGLAIAIFLVLSYFIKFNLEAGSNYVVKDSLLGVLIFHNAIVLGIYVLISIILILSGLAKINLTN